MPAVFLGEHFAPESHTTLFVLAVLAIVPLAALLSHATESVAAKTGDAVGGLLNATLGNLKELVIAITALRAGMFDLVKASIAGAIVTNSLLPARRPQIPCTGIQRRDGEAPGRNVVPGGGSLGRPFSDRWF